MVSFLLSLWISLRHVDTQAAKYVVLKFGKRRENVKIPIENASK